MPRKGGGGHYTRSGGYITSTGRHYASKPGPKSGSSHSSYSSSGGYYTSSGYVTSTGRLYASKPGPKSSSSSSGGYYTSSGYVTSTGRLFASKPGPKPGSSSCGVSFSGGYITSTGRLFASKPGPKSGTSKKLNKTTYDSSYLSGGSSLDNTFSYGSAYNYNFYPPLNKIQEERNDNYVLDDVPPRVRNTHVENPQDPKRKIKQILEDNFLICSLDDCEVFTNKYKNNQCLICLEDFDDEKPFGKLKKCKHFFHYKCLKKWFKTDSKRACPTCKVKY